jgi:hypothetical protein
MRTVTHNNSSRVLNVCRGRQREPRPVARGPQVQQVRTPARGADFARALAARARLRRQSRGLRARRTCYPNAKSPPAPRGRLDYMIERRRGTGGGIALHGARAVGAPRRRRVRIEADELSLRPPDMLCGQHKTSTYSKPGS